jgi:aclacinomycin oxidase
VTADIPRNGVILDKVRPGDARYADLAARNANGRARGEPDVFYVARSAAEVVAALGDAVSSGLRLAARSGGQCHEDFVAHDAVRAVIDTALMNRIVWDPARGAFGVDCGATLGELYRTLHLGWGVMLPAGVSPDVGVGGHILGGGFGYFARRHGLAVDHLHAVEVAVVDRDGRARLAYASCEAGDPHRELWWAHTGGGGGNFGIVTRYWLRSPGAVGETPSGALPRSPTSLTRFQAAWRWADLDETRFARLVRNHGVWCETHSAPGAPETALYATLVLTPRTAAGQVMARGVCSAEDRPEAMIADYLAALDHGVGGMSTPRTESPSWLGLALSPLPRPRLSKMKDAFLKQGLDDAQIAAIYHHLTRPRDTPIAVVLGLGTYGGAVNALAPHATASAQREAVITFYGMASWSEPADEAAHLAWLRALYSDLFQDSGGAPAPGAIADGAFINHPDRDLADPRWNRSGTPWQTLYYKDNYPRLQRIKAQWDPLNIFRHALSITAP